MYQAQFAYEQFGEWQGTILKKALNPDGTVEHDADFPGNWDAAEKIKEQSTAAGSSDGEIFGQLCRKSAISVIGIILIQILKI